MESSCLHLRRLKWKVPVGIFACLVLLMLSSVVSMEMENNYDELLIKLKNSVRDNFDVPLRRTDTAEISADSKVVTCVVGKICKHDLTKLFGKHDPLLGAIENGKGTLPDWILLKHDKIIAIPTIHDIGTHSIIFSGLHKENAYLKIRVIELSESLFRCSNPGDNVMVGSVMFNADSTKLGAEGRLELLRKASNFLDIDMHRTVLVEGTKINSGNLFGSSVLSAGPGDRLLPDEPGVTFLWRAKCGTDITGDKTLVRIRSAAADGSMRHEIGYSVIGWFITSRGPRQRRQAVRDPKGTPVPSLGPVSPKATSVLPMGTPMITATPVLVPSETVMVIKSSRAVPTTSKPPAVMSTEVISPSRSTSAVVPTTSIQDVVTTPAPPPTTEPPTTQPSTEKSTSQKPVTTVADSTTPSPTPMTTKPPTKPVVPPTGKVNQPPRIALNIGTVKIDPNQLYYLHIENDMVSDQEDKDFQSLKLQIKVLASETPTDVSWIEYDSSRRMIYALPSKSAAGSHEFALVVTDSQGANSSEQFTIDVSKDSLEHNSVFNITIDTDFDKFTKKLWNRANLIQSIAIASHVNYTAVRFHNMSRGSVIFAWSNAEIEETKCNTPAAERYLNTIKSTEFRDSLAGQYNVIDSGFYQVVPCDGNVVIGKGSGSGSGWWSKIIIPIIVVIFVLLLIALICCCVYRRKHKYSPPSEETNGFLHNKKPVIFREEYEEKPDLLCLEPVILPNEKPPMCTPGYVPRSSTPDGAGSSTISTESDEKAPLHPSTPSSKDSPRKPMGRSPPPYSS